MKIVQGIHMTLYATGCIFEYDEAHPIGGAGFKEEDKPNFDGAWQLPQHSVVVCMISRL